MSAIDFSGPATSIPRTDLPVPADQEEQRLRVGFISHLDQTDDLHAVYGLNVELAQGLESLGYDSFWVATRHFNAGWSALPSPFAFYGAVAQATSRINLGTAVLPIIVDDPLRVAEEVAVLDYLSGGRLQLGLGKGVPSPGYHVFSRWGADRDSSFVEKTLQLAAALEGRPVADSETVVYPANHSLAGRLYHGTSNWDTIASAAEAGHGFILERFGSGDERIPENRAAFQRRQADSILHYRNQFEQQWGGRRTPRVVLSRSAWPGPDRDSALAEAAAATAHWNEFARSVGRLRQGLTPAEELLSDNVPWGDSAELAADLLADPTVLLSDELVLGIHPGRLDLDQTLRKAQVLIKEVIPLVQQGWVQARADWGAQVQEFGAERSGDQLGQWVRTSF